MSGGDLSEGSDGIILPTHRSSFSTHLVTECFHLYLAFRESHFVSKTQVINK